MTSLAQRITDERLRRGLGQLTLARLLMVSPGVLCGWEQGRTLPPASKIEHMERLGLNLSGAPRALDPSRHTLNLAELDARVLCGVPRLAQRLRLAHAAHQDCA